MKNFILALISILAFSAYNYAQLNTIPRPATTLTTTTLLKPAVLNMKNLKNTSLGLQLQQQYSSSFSNAQKVISYGDGSHLTINIQKNPYYANQSSGINALNNGTTNSTSNGMNCATSHVTVNATSTTFMNADYASQGPHIYPGAIYALDHFYDGSYREETNYRNSIMISTDNPNISGDAYVNVTSPNMGTINTAIAQLYGRFVGTPASESLTYQAFESDNSADMNIKVTAGGSGYGFNFNNVFSTANQSKTVYLTIDAKKILFTMNVVPPTNGFFNNSSESSLPNLMVIGSVQYGVRVLANLQITFNSQQDADNFSAKYNGEAVSGNVDLSYLSSNSSVQSTINCYVVGGPANSTISFDKSQLQNEINSILSGATYQNARPIEFEMYDMAGDVIGTQSATDQFTTQLCVPGDPALQNALVSVNCGSDGKDHDTHYSYNLYNGSGTLMASYTNNSDNTQFNDNSTGNPNQLGNSGSPTMSAFMNSGGGHLHLHIEPNGHDTWDIAQLTLTLTFNNGPQQIISWQNVVVSQDNKDHDFYFSAAFKPE